MSYQGSCHCGAVSFSVEGDPPAEAISCNCSHCRRKGVLLTFVPVQQFTLESGQDMLTTYRFNTHVLEHQFCATCGTQAFAFGKGPDGARMAAINLRCVPSVDLDGLKLTPYDGASA